MRLTELTRFVDDVQSAVEFYTTMLGTEPIDAWPGGAVFEVGDVTVLIHEAVEHDSVPGEDHPAFAVDDVDATCEALAADGLEIEWPPAEYDWGRAAYLRDPAGNLLELLEAA